MILRLFLRVILKWPLRLFRLILTVFAFVLIALTVFGMFFNFNWLSNNIEALVLKKTGRIVQVNGDIKPGLDWVRPSLVLNDVVIFDDEPLRRVHFKRAEISVPLMKMARAKYPIIYLRVAGISVQGYKVGSLFLPVHIRNAEHVTSNVSGTILEGALAGTVRLFKGTYDVDLRVENADYGRFFKGVEGKVALTVVGKTKKTNKINDFYRSLNGRVELSGSEGQFPSGTLDFWTKSLLTSLLPGKKEFTSLNCLYADVKIVNGIAQTDKMVVDTNDLTMWGKGKVDLLSQKIDMDITPQPKDASILNMATKVHLKGYFDQIEIVPDAMGVASKLGGVILGAVVPAAAILPFTKLGFDKKDPCKPIKDKTK